MPFVISHASSHVVDGSFCVSVSLSLLLTAVFEASQRRLLETRAEEAHASQLAWDAGAWESNSLDSSARELEACSRNFCRISQA